MLFNRTKAATLKLEGTPVIDYTQRTGVVTRLYRDYAVRVRWSDGSTQRVSLADLSIDTHALAQRRRTLCEGGGLFEHLRGLSDRIDAFDSLCQDAEYTDTDQAWTLFNHIRNTLRDTLPVISDVCTGSREIAASLDNAMSDNVMPDSEMIEDGVGAVRDLLRLFIGAA
jgi:hypothetical protein